MKARLEALERKVHTCECQKHKAEGAIQYMGLAPESKEELTPGITARPDTSPDGYENCPQDGNTRKKWYNGVCYCQMCCGGQWVDFCYSSGNCIRCGDAAVTVNCNGSNRILHCLPG